MSKDLLVGLVAGAALVIAPHAEAEEWTSLLDMELSQFEVWVGIPLESVEGLPPGTERSKDYREGVPIGLDADVKNIYSMAEDNGEPMLQISGEIFGALTTLKEYENYHLSLKLKWGEKKWEPRLENPRGGGILYHAHGDHGAMWGVFKSCLEFQVQETDLGDFVPLAGTSGEVRTIQEEGKRSLRFDPTSDELRSGYISANLEPDAPHGEWNHLELYAVGDTSVHVVNGEIVMVVENAKKGDGSPLTRGQIQIQSEGAEHYYKEIKIRSISDFPTSIKSRIRLRD